MQGTVPQMAQTWLRHVTPPVPIMGARRDAGANQLPLLDLSVMPPHGRSLPLATGWGRRSHFSLWQETPPLADLGWAGTQRGFSSWQSSEQERERLSRCTFQAMHSFPKGRKTEKVQTHQPTWSKHRRAPKWQGLHQLIKGSSLWEESVSQPIAS